MAFNLKIGEGLLNDVSKSMQNANGVDVQLVPPDKILEHDDNNGLSMEGIEELQASIEDVGLKQLPVLLPLEDGMYRILAGHRRITAIKKSIAEGTSRYRLGIPCMLENLSLIDIPIPDDMKEKYILATTNTEARELTTSDKIELARIMSEVYAAMDQQGRKPRGKRRDFIANKLNVSPAQIQRFENIDRNLIPEFRESMNEMPLVVANTIAKLPEPEQKQLYETSKNTGLTTDTVNKFVGIHKTPKANISGCSYEHPPASRVESDKGVHMNTPPKANPVNELCILKKTMFYYMKDVMFRFNTTVLENEELFISEGDYQALKDAVEDVTRQISGIIKMLKFKNENI